jgi:hypothetical protein
VVRELAEAASTVRLAVVVVVGVKAARAAEQVAQILIVVEMLVMMPQAIAAAVGVGLARVRLVATELLRLQATVEPA